MAKQKKILQIGNAIGFLIVIIVNYLANTGIFNDTTMAGISSRYENLFTPAGYAFSFWGLIYLALGAFVIYQGRSSFRKSSSDRIVQEIGWWFVVSCAANVSWIIAFLYDQILLSVFIMLILLFSLIRIIIRTRMELDDVPLKRIAFVWWPFSLYSGWIAVALIANVAAWLVKVDWDGFGLSQVTWTVFMIGVAGIINLIITWTRNMREFALVGVWGLIAIAVANYGTEPVVTYVALLIALILFISSGIHAYKNRNSLPW